MSSIPAAAFHGHCAGGTARSLYDIDDDFLANISEEEWVAAEAATAARAAATAAQQINQPKPAGFFDRFAALPADIIQQLTTAHFTLKDFASLARTSKDLCRQFWGDPKALVPASSHADAWLKATNKRILAHFRLGFSDEDQARVQKFSLDSPRTFLKLIKPLFRYMGFDPTCARLLCQRSQLLACHRNLFHDVDKLDKPNEGQQVFDDELDVDQFDLEQVFVKGSPSREVLRLNAAQTRVCVHKGGVAMFDFVDHYGWEDKQALEALKKTGAAMRKALQTSANSGKAPVKTPPRVFCGELAGSAAGAEYECQCQNSKELVPVPVHMDVVSSDGIHEQHELEVNTVLWGLLIISNRDFYEDVEIGVYLQVEEKLAFVPNCGLERQPQEVYQLRLQLHTMHPYVS